MDKKGIREYYDKTARLWADKFYDDEENVPVLKDFMSKLPRRPRVLDLCCGAGYDSMRLARMGARVVGIDLSRESIAIAREKNPGISFFVRDMLGNYKPIGKVDAIICCAGLVHLPVEKLRTAFERMAEVTETGASVLLVVREGEGRVDEMSDLVVDGEAYDRAFYAHSLRELTRAAEGLFVYEREIGDSERSVWVNAVFRRV